MTDHMLKFPCVVRREDLLLVGEHRDSEGALRIDVSLGGLSSRHSVIWLNRVNFDALLDHLVELSDRPLLKMARAAAKAKRAATKKVSG